MLIRRRRRRCRSAAGDSGETMASLIIAMVLTALVMPAVLVMVYNLNRLIAHEPDPDTSVAAEVQLQPMFSRIDPVRYCETPTTAIRDLCVQTAEVLGAALLEPPVDVLVQDPLAVCFQTVAPDARPVPAGSPAAVRPPAPYPLVAARQCIMLLDEGHDEPGTDSRHPYAFSESDSLRANIDKQGGDVLILRTWLSLQPGSVVPSTHPQAAVLGRLGDVRCALAPRTAQSTAPCSTTAAPDGEALYLPAFEEDAYQIDLDRVLYFDVEWWCMRWRHPADPAVGPLVGPWLGGCPCPSDAHEQRPLPFLEKTIAAASSQPQWSADASVTLPAELRRHLQSLDTDGDGMPDWADNNPNSAAVPGDGSQLVPRLVDSDSADDWPQFDPDGDGYPDPPDCDERYDGTTPCQGNVGGALGPISAPEAVPILGNDRRIHTNCAEDGWWLQPDPPGPTARSRQNYRDAVADMRRWLLPPAASHPSHIDYPARLRAQVPSRVATVELQVCTALSQEERLRGDGHCRIDTLRFSLID